MFLASRVLLLILALLAALVCVEMFVFGAATVGAAFSQHRASVSDFFALAGSLLIAVVVVVAVKYVFRPPAVRVRYWVVFVALLLTVGLAADFLLG
jgi:hypothetical protein